MSNLRTVDLHCGICVQDKPKSDFIFINGCSHRYCSKCIGTYVSIKIRNNMAKIACPQPVCKDGSLEPELCKPVLARELFDRWSNALIKDKFYCPYKDCSALLITDIWKDKEGCPYCNRFFCFKCKSPWHPELACEDFQKLGKNEIDMEDLMLMELAKRQGWKRCPFCRFYVEKVSGCLSLKCRCGHVFCYNCGTTMTEDHYCAACRH
ncbi:hypothetical protein KFK09_020195 [Dendrobium nobile]|uniref:RBR-type E3 ubiquitin transferase n=1 Tax=Dendrobium nobile TaxID=94219 RepID=A0A8T3AUA0_DENNO|nr:hypothetical protein KFK09_020195 [Dendrobium nobile]